MSDIFREVDEELKHERYALLWKKYGQYVIGLAVVLVLAVAGYQGWEWYRGSVRMSESERFVAAMELAAEGRQQDALGRFEALAAESATGYEVLARFRTASLRREAGDVAGAVAAYEEIASDGDVDDIYRQLANLLIALNTLDEAEPDALQARLEPLAGPGAPWRHTAREALAALALRRGDVEAAGTLYRELSDDGETPQGIRARAAEMLAVIGQNG